MSDCRGLNEKFEYQPLAPYETYCGLLLKTVSILCLVDEYLEAFSFYKCQSDAISWSEPITESRIPY